MLPKTKYYMKCPEAGANMKTLRKRNRGTLNLFSRLHRGAADEAVLFWIN